MLLVGCALCDALDGADSGAMRRLALSSAFAAATKNEGLFLAAAACVAAVVFSLRSPAFRPRGVRSAAAALLPALALTALRRAALGPAPLRDLDAGLLAPARWPELVPRVARALAAAAALAAPAWPILLAAVILFACGRRSAAGDRLLAILLACTLAYALIPALGRQAARVARAYQPSAHRRGTGDLFCVPRSRCATRAAA